jgi:hypothetical protein
MGGFNPRLSFFRGEVVNNHSHFYSIVGRFESHRTWDFRVHYGILPIFEPDSGVLTVLEPTLRGSNYIRTQFGGS